MASASSFDWLLDPDSLSPPPSSSRSRSGVDTNYETRIRAALSGLESGMYKSLRDAAEKQRVSRSTLSDRKNKKHKPWPKSLQRKAPRNRKVVVSDPLEGDMAWSAEPHPSASRSPSPFPLSDPPMPPKHAGSSSDPLVHPSNIPESSSQQIPTTIPQSSSQQIPTNTPPQLHSASHSLVGDATSWDTYDLSSRSRRDLELDVLTLRNILRRTEEHLAATRHSLQEEIVQHAATTARWMLLTRENESLREGLSRSQQDTD